MHPRKLIVTALLALLALAVTTGIAAAHRGLGIEGETRITGTDATVTWTSGERVYTCEITLHGTIASLTAKTRGAAIGSMTGGRVNEAGCRDNIFGVTLREELRTRSLFPWPLSYDSFGGTLPSVTSLVISLRPRRRANIFEVFGELLANCYYEATYTMTLEAPRIAAINVNGAESLIRSEGPSPELCPVERNVEAQFVLASLLAVILLT